MKLVSPLLVALTTVAGQATVAGAATDHYTCYKARTTVGTAKFQSVRGVTLHDRVRVSTVQVNGPRNLCLPTNKNGEDPAASDNPEHLEDYRIRPVQRFTKVLNQQVSDQFGSIVVDLRKPDTLMVPTAKDLATPPDPLTAPAVDHFQCYRVTRAKGRPKFQLVPGVTIEDQFGTMTVDVRKPLRLCHPVDKNGESPDAQSHPESLMCYRIRQASLPKFQRRLGLYTQNQFGPSASTPSSRPSSASPRSAFPRSRRRPRRRMPRRRSHGRRLRCRRPRPDPTAATTSSTQGSSATASPMPRARRRVSPTASARPVATTPSTHRPSSATVSPASRARAPARRIASVPSPATSSMPACACSHSRATTSPSRTPPRPPGGG